MSDNSLPVRRNVDQCTNYYGVKLLCGSTRLRIMNGRHKDEIGNGFTFCGSRGCVVDNLSVQCTIFVLWNSL